MPLTFVEIKQASEFTSGAFLFCHQLDQLYFPTPWNEKQWKGLFTESHSLYLARKGEDFIGFCLFANSYVDSFAHLLKILVHPDNRGRHFGEDLLNESMKRLKLEGIKSFFLEVEESNCNAIKLYEKCGFKTIHVKKHFYTSGESALIMTHEI